MKEIFRTLGVLATAVLTLASCLGDDDEQVTTYSDMAITAVTLGTLNRYTETTSAKTGNDTIVKTTVTGSNYRMTIDHLGRQIYNQDSLPLGTDVAHVLISAVSTKNSGVVYLKSLTSDSLRYISSTDSVDFSQPRILRVFAIDGSGSRDYTMTLNVSKTTGLNFEWRKVATRDDLAGWTDSRLLAYADSVVLAPDGTIATADGDTLGLRPAMQGISRLIGATAHGQLMALGTDGRLKTSDDGQGLSWTDETLDDDPALLPVADIAMVSWSYAPADSTDYLLLAGTSAEGKSVVWRKLSRYHQDGRPAEGRWTYMPAGGTNRYALPAQQGLSLACYDGSVLAVGSQMQMLESRDQGITWKTTDTYALPDALEGSRLSMAADRQGRLWLLTDSGQLWMGMLR